MAKMFFAFCKGVDTPRSLKAWLLVKNEEYEQLAEFKVHPLEYCQADAFAVDYGVTSFLKKNADLPWKKDTRTPAIAAFASSESRCKTTNEVLRAWTHGQLCVDRDVVEVIHLAQRKISMLLGNVGSVDDEAYLWGPGATFDLPRRRAYPDTKLVELPLTVTGSAWKHACAMLASDLHWKEAIIAHNPGYTGPIFRVIPGGRYDTVPKTVLTDRSILVEPRLNTILQKRVGSRLRGLLKRVDVDLDDQFRNQYLAEFAMTLDLATLDLEAASDTVSIEVVKLLLPPDWFELLDDLRSKWYLGDEGWVRLEKFSSMGNGFTFELESLIYWAITAAASELSYKSILGIYGDDIVAPRKALPRLKATLSFLGFTLNKSKSFEDGLFFESCGKHFFGGIDVTPLYQKEVPRDGASAARLGNRLLRYAARLGHHAFLDKRIRGAWEEWRRENDPRADSFGPYLGTGDGYWEAPASALSTRTRSGFSGAAYRVACYSEVKRVIPANDNAMYAIWLQSRNRPSEEERVCDPHRLPPIGDPLVTVKGTSKNLRIGSTLSESGFIASRLKPRYVMKHRWVQSGPLSTVLDW